MEHDPEAISANAKAVSESLDTLTRNGYRLVGRQIYHPSKGADSFPSLDFPKTHQEIDNLLSCLDTRRLERAVGQWLVEGCVTSEKCQTLLKHLTGLVQVSCNIRQELQNTVDWKQYLAMQEAKRRIDTGG